jgi:hypothetical protein
MSTDVGGKKFDEPPDGAGRNVVFENVNSRKKYDSLRAAS